MEMNTRLQVEHPVTEMITNTDLVEWQLLVASGKNLPLRQNEIKINGHSFESRIYAENPEHGFLPASGKIEYLNDFNVSQLDSVRVETGVRTNDEISVFYDPMISKLVVWGENREAALTKMRQVLNGYHLAGLSTNISFLKRLCTHEAFVRADVHTDFIPQHEKELLPENLEVGEEVLALGAVSILSIAAESEAENAKRSIFRKNANSAALSNLFFQPTTSRKEKIHIIDSKSRNSVDWEAEVTKLSKSSDFLIRLTNGERTGSHELQLSDVSVSYQGKNAANFQAVINNQLFSWYAILLADKVHIFTSSGVSECVNIKPFTVSSSDSALSSLADRAISPMPGVIEKVNIRVGESVKAGQTLVVMMAMKMEYSINAVKSGVVEEVFCKSGDNVGKSDILVKLKVED